MTFFRDRQMTCQFRFLIDQTECRSAPCTGHRELIQVGRKTREFSVDRVDWLDREGKG